MSCSVAYLLDLSVIAMVGDDSGTPTAHRAVVGAIPKALSTIHVSAYTTMDAPSEFIVADI